ncbi:MAG: RDD family protein [Vicinamibacteria bacterium]|nr:RDD family protein [Vicinamibacteria bacterium]
MNDSRLQQRRLIAAGIDVGIGFGLSVILLIGGWIIGLLVRLVIPDHAVGIYLWRMIACATAFLILAYILGRDTFAGGRSFGKKLQDVRVVAGSGTITLMDSVKRNAIFAVGPAVWLLMAAIQLVPYLGDIVACVFIPLNALGIVASVAAMIVEVIKIMQDPYGIRFGDQLANTRVVG